MKKINFILTSRLRLKEIFSWVLDFAEIIAGDSKNTKI
jgi:hypothetical protein